ncbi:MAG: hypothetical protein ACKO34_00020, partial [Vampirovibrionales bacterium]
EIKAPPIFATLRTSKASQSDLEANGETIYATLKTQALESGDPQTASDFYFWQQWYKLKGSLFKEKPIEWVYYSLSMFGLSVWVPSLWFVGSSFAFAGLYHGLNTPTVVGSFIASAFKPVSDALFIKEWVATLGLLLPNETKESFKLVMTTANEDSGLLMGFLVTIQLLLHGFLVFQIGSAIRNKVKR